MSHLNIPWHPVCQRFMGWTGRFKNVNNIADAVLVVLQAPLQHYECLCCRCIMR
jgi:hypothetical protein